MPARQSKVKVYVRTRPTENFANDIIEFGHDMRSLNIYNKRPASQGYVNNQITDWSFKVDGILNNVTQDTVYDEVVRDTTNNCLDGYNGTILCYGQTGAGKTFTMTGATENYQQRGLIPRTIQHLFKEINNRQDNAFTVRIGYIEIYNEQIFDLLSNSPSDQQLSVYDDRGDVFVKGLTYALANAEEDALNLLFEGETNRAIGQHVLNKVSSRSHCIFTIRIESKSLSSSDEKYTLSKLNLVDLAGSERLAKTQSVGVTQKEAQYINKSLSFLEQAVIGLSDPRKPFVQFRQSKLTHILKDSIGGNCMTTMIANVWPESRHMEETVSTLRFASRMMNVSVEPAINEVIDPMRMMQKLDNEVKILRQELAMHDSLANRRNQGYEPLSEHQLLEIENNCRKFLDGSIDEIEISNIRQIQATFAAFKKICKRMEKDVEAKFRERYTIIDKNDADQIAEAQKAGIPINDDGSLVGEVDGQGFGIGVANKDMRAGKADLLKAAKGKRGGKALNKAPSPTLDSRGQMKQVSELTKENLRKEQSKDVATPSAIAKEPSRPSTPPSKQVAFEEFKQERGNEINRILNENKDILASKRRQYSDIAHRVNDAKAKIDETRIAVERKRTERMTLGEFVNEFGETVIDEEEFALIKNLQDLKSRYREDYDKWKELKAEISYCQNLVEQCRQRLLKEFEQWYNETYYNNLLYTNNAAKSMSDLRLINSSQKPYEDAAEKFQRMQKEIMLTDIDSVPYRSARIRSDRRHTYENAMSQPQPSFIQSRQPGTPIRYINNPPPGKLSVN